MWLIDKNYKKLCKLYRCKFMIFLPETQTIEMMATTFKAFSLN